MWPGTHTPPSLWACCILCIKWPFLPRLPSRSNQPNFQRLVYTASPQGSFSQPFDQQYWPVPLFDQRIVFRPLANIFLDSSLAAGSLSVSTAHQSIATVLAAPDASARIPWGFLTLFPARSLWFMSQPTLASASPLLSVGFLISSVVKEKPTGQCRRHERCGFNSWVGKIPWGENSNLLQFCASKIPWTEELGGLWSVELQRIRQDWAFTHSTLCWYLSFPILTSEASQRFVIFYIPSLFWVTLKDTLLED